jgi:hypothetical protein
MHSFARGFLVTSMLVGIAMVDAGVSKSTVEGFAVAFAVAVLERAALACVRGERLCMPEGWGGDGASGAGAASGDASGVAVGRAFCAGSAVGGGVELVA